MVTTNEKPATFDPQELTVLTRKDFVTDNGNIILDVHNLEILDPSALETEINQLAGVVTVGLFARRPADVLLIAGDGGVERIER